MPISAYRISLATSVLLIAFAVGLNGEFLASRAIWAQDESPKSESSTDPDALKKLIERINKLEAEVDRLKNAAPVADGAAEQQVMAMLDVAHLGHAYSGNQQPRFLALHVMLANTTKQAFTISQEQVVAEIDGEERKLKELPRYLLNHSVPIGKQHVVISSMKPPKEWKLPAGGQTGLWLVYPELPLGSNVPKCRLKIKIGDVTKEINVNDLQRAQLSLDIQRIGPRQSLALITINGAMNSFNTGSFVDELDKLVDEKVARVAIRWGDGATLPDQQLMNWLQLAAVGNGGNPNQIPSLPVIPSGIREFHLTEFPSSDDNQGRNTYAFGLRPTTQPRIHKTSAESVGAALRTAYLALPRDELLNEIKTGHPLTRAAALSFGGGRLDVDQLPQIFEWAEDKDPEMQKAAILALSHFGEPQAIDKLVFYAQRNVEPLSGAAIESLAGSRFGAAHDALLKLLKNEPHVSKKKIVQVLAKYPRAIWSDTLFEFVTDSPEGMDADSLRALVQVGHPQLVDVLERALKSTVKAIRDQAFQELAKRSDERSERLAVEYALKSLETGPPDTTVLQLLSRTKEPRAIPLLLKQLDSGSDRTNSINLLLQIGDQTVAESMVQKYSSLSNNEKVQVLQGLKPFHHPRFRELCGEALLTNDNQMVTTAANALAQDGHLEGEKLLIVAIDKQKSPHLLGNIMNALANFGTPLARTALTKARDSGDSSKKQYATQALANLRQRSPGFQFIFQANNFRMNNQDKEAMEAYNMSVQLDPALPEAYTYRGLLLIKLEKFEPAKNDFDKAIDLDPAMSQAYLYRGELFNKTEKYEAAKNDFDKVIDLDPKSGLGYMSRGKLFLKTEKFGSARKDFEKVMELKDQPLDAEFVTSFAIARIGDGQFVEGVKYLEDHRAKQLELARESPEKGIKGLFLYNTACAYARAIEQVDKQTDLADRATLREQYRKQAIADLTESFKQGFDDYDWTAKDPDFKILYHDADFKKILAGKPAKKSGDKPIRDKE